MNNLGSDYRCEQTPMLVGPDRLQRFNRFVDRNVRPFDLDEEIS